MDAAVATERPACNVQKNKLHVCIQISRYQKVDHMLHVTVGSNFVTTKKDCTVKVKAQNIASKSQFIKPVILTV